MNLVWIHVLITEYKPDVNRLTVWFFLKFYRVIPNESFYRYISRDFRVTDTEMTSYIEKN